MVWHLGEEQHGWFPCSPVLREVPHGRVPHGVPDVSLAAGLACETLLHNSCSCVEPSLLLPARGLTHISRGGLGSFPV